jgi:hypothetical protein
MPETTTETFGTRFWKAFKGFFAWIWNFIKKLSPKILGLIAALVVIVIAVILVSAGFKELQIGGILGKLLGKKGGATPGQGPTVETANSIDPKRVGPDGKLIPQGVPDAKGDTQAVVVPIKPPGLFSDPNTVTYTAPGDTQPTVVPLPTGVTSKQVDQVIVVQPNVVAVTVKDTSGVKAETIDALLKKYGS